jgi:uncharacterized cupin superfamily protein
METKTGPINDEGACEPFQVDDVAWEEWSKGERLGSRYRMLGKFGGGSHVGVQFEELAPGKQSNLVHYHMVEEEHVYILEGEVTLILGKNEYAMKAGSYVCFPAGQKVGHALINRSDKPCRYLVIGENNPHDVCVYPETDRVGVRILKDGYRLSARKEYWEGIELESDVMVHERRHRRARHGDRRSRSHCWSERLIAGSRRILGGPALTA